MKQCNRNNRLKPGKSSPMTITHPNAAGIDIGSASHYVAAPQTEMMNPSGSF